MPLTTATPTDAEDIQVGFFVSGEAADRFDIQVGQFLAGQQ